MAIKELLPDTWTIHNKMNYSLIDGITNPVIQKLISSLMTERLSCNGNKYTYVKAGYLFQGYFKN